MTRMRAMISLIEVVEERKKIWSCQQKLDKTFVRRRVERALKSNNFKARQLLQNRVKMHQQNDVRKRMTRFEIWVSILCFICVSAKTIRTASRNDNLIFKRIRVVCFLFENSNSDWLKQSQGSNPNVLIDETRVLTSAAGPFFWILYDDNYFKKS